MEEKILTIEKVVFGGKGLSRDLGKVTLVPFTLPGEKVRVRITRERRDYQEAEVTEILERSPERIAPACRYFGHCGGCQISHANYETQVKCKIANLEESFARNHLPVPDIQIITAEPYNYRHRARFKFHSKNGEIGFFERESNRIIDVHECLCLTPALNELLIKLRKHLHGTSMRGITEIDCFENDRGETVAYFNGRLPRDIRQRLEKEIKVYDVAEIEGSHLTLRFRDYELPMRPDIFLQINPGLWKAMIQEVESHYQDHKEKVAIELYSGAGFFTIPLSRHFEKITACEENRAAIEFAKTRYPGKNIDWICAGAERFKFPENATAAIMDPPRSGLDRMVTQKLLQHPFRKLSYVSCDCSSLGRDLKILSDRYELKDIVLFDLFPQTFHFETISLLRSVRKEIGR